MRDRELEMILQRLQRERHARPVSQDRAIPALPTRSGPLAVVDGMVDEMVDDDALTSILEPPFDRDGRRSPSAQGDLPAHADVMPPSVGHHLDAGRTSDPREDDLMPIRRFQGRTWGETDGTATIEPARPAVEVGEDPVGDADRSTDEDGVGHVPVTSATNAMMRSSSGSAS